MIRYLKNSDINRTRWDHCIANAINGLCYAYSWYLDIVCQEWNALVEDNYVSVMPIPIRSKLKLRLLLQPPLTQQLGIFSSTTIPKELIEEYIRLIPIKNYNLNLNESNSHPSAIAYPNYLLPLNSTYDILKQKYHSNTLRNLKKGIDLTIDTNVTIAEMMALCQNYPFWNTKYTLIATQIIEQAQTHSNGRIIGIRDEQGKLKAVASLLISNQRITYHIAASDKSENNHAMFTLVDAIIKEYANTGMLLDFEGSKEEGIARFYAGFGANKVPYYNIQKGLITSIYNLKNKF